MSGPPGRGGRLRVLREAPARDGLLRPELITLEPGGVTISNSIALIRPRLEHRSSPPRTTAASSIMLGPWSVPHTGPSAHTGLRHAFLLRAASLVWAGLCAVLFAEPCRRGRLADDGGRDADVLFPSAQAGASNASPLEPGGVTVCIRVALIHPARHQADKKTRFAGAKRPVTPPRGTWGT